MNSTIQNLLLELSHLLNQIATDNTHNKSSSENRIEIYAGDFCIKIPLECPPPTPQQNKNDAPLPMKIDEAIDIPPRAPPENERRTTAPLQPISVPKLTSFNTIPEEDTTGDKVNRQELEFVPQRTHSPDRNAAAKRMMARRRFETKEDVTTRHATFHHRGRNKRRQFTCEECGKRFLDRNVLMRHQRIHVGYKPFGCDVCNRKFSEKHCLVKHLATIHNRQVQQQAGARTFYALDLGATRPRAASDEVPVRMREKESVL